ncbi:MAG: tRNA (adenosine(37)-N6)-threonylcarbamoyltransferase complex dimerization subunit type 1 TsaB [Gammaproteobacteria bacterium]
MTALRILALDTSTEACSAALLVGREVSERYQWAPREHASLILGMIDQLLAEAEIGLGQLDAVAFGRGPGAFTGVRIATGVVQGIAFGADLPVVPVSSLKALAEEMRALHGHQRVLAAIDARMGEVYWGVYRAGADDRWQAEGEEQVAPAESVNLPEEGDWCGVGSGWQAYGERLAVRLGPRLCARHPDHYPRARSVAALGAVDFRDGLAVSAEEALPVYLRNRVVQAPC